MPDPATGVRLPRRELPAGASPGTGARFRCRRARAHARSCWRRPRARPSAAGDRRARHAAGDSDRARRRPPDGRSSVEPAVRSIGHRDRDRPIQRDDRRRLDALEQIVESYDLRPVGIFAVVQPGNAAPRSRPGARTGRVRRVAPRRRAAALRRSDWHPTGSDPALRERRRPPPRRVAPRAASRGAASARPARSPPPAERASSTCERAGRGESPPHTGRVGRAVRHAWPRSLR